jgi:undecaprenyl-diphosphatase
LLGWDRQLDRWVVAHRVGVLNPVFEGLTYAGSYGAVWLGIGLLVAIVSGRRAVFLWTLAAFVLGEASSTLLKAAIPRARPHVDALVSLPGTHSFPSGHATVSFACATVLGAALPRLRVPFYLLAALISWSRVYVGVHYPVDVLAGAVLGTALGLGLLRALPWLAEARRRSLRAPRPG